MTDKSKHPPSQSSWSNFKRIPTSETWFEVYEITPSLFTFHEPRHYEETNMHLLVGPDKAILIDSGCGIGNLRKAVEEITRKPVMVINSHTHLDHIGSNSQFDDIAMFDHPLSHQVAQNGVDHQTLQTEILAENLITGPFPEGFDPDTFELPPFKVNHWLNDGDRTDLEVIHTPGESPDHICLLDRASRILFCGDILLHGPIWTHLDGGSLTDLIMSYRKLMAYYDDFDHLMPAHNEPWLSKELLPSSLNGAEKVASGQADYRVITDPWDRQLREYPFDLFSIRVRD